MPADCPECDGTGALTTQVGPFARYYERCPVCGGSGVIEPLIEEEPTE